MCCKIFIFVVQIALFVFYHDRNQVNAAPFYTNNSCRQICPRTYVPVCAGPLMSVFGATDNNINTFYNLCLLQKYNCEHLTNWYVKYNGLCYGNTAYTVQSG